MLHIPIRLWKPRHMSNRCKIMSQNSHFLGAKKSMFQARKPKLRSETPVLRLPMHNAVLIIVSPALTCSQEIARQPHFSARGTRQRKTTNHMPLPSRISIILWSRRISFLCCWEARVHPKVHFANPQLLHPVGHFANPHVFGPSAENILLPSHHYRVPPWKSGRLFCANLLSIAHHTELAKKCSTIWTRHICAARLVLAHRFPDLCSLDIGQIDKCNDGENGIEHCENSASLCADA